MLPRKSFICVTLSRTVNKTDNRSWKSKYNKLKRLAKLQGRWYKVLEQALLTITKHKARAEDGAASAGRGRRLLMSHYSCLSNWCLQSCRPFIASFAYNNTYWTCLVHKVVSKSTEWSLVGRCTLIVSVLTNELRFRFTQSLP